MILPEIAFDRSPDRVRVTPHVEATLSCGVILEKPAASGLCHHAVQLHVSQAASAAQAA